MAEIFVQSSSAIQGVIDELKNLNTQFRQKADEIRTEQTNLTAKWEGDASTAFHEHFQKEEPNFETFASAVDDYVRGLEEIKASYEQAEQANTNIASN